MSQSNNTVEKGDDDLYTLINDLWAVIREPCEVTSDISNKEFITQASNPESQVNPGFTAETVHDDDSNISMSICYDDYDPNKQDLEQATDTVDAASLGKEMHFEFKTSDDNSRNAMPAWFEGNQTSELKNIVDATNVVADEELSVASN